MARGRFSRKIAEEAVGLIGQDPRGCKVGAVLLLKDGSCITANGRSTPLGVKFHAEAAVIDKARAGGLATGGAVLYTTLEPCIEEVRHFQDRPCYLLIADAGISQVYYGVADPNREIRGEGRRRLIGLGVPAEPFPADLQRSIVRQMGKWYRDGAAVLTSRDIRDSLLARRPRYLKRYTGFAVDGAIDAAPCPSLRRGWLLKEVTFEHKAKEFQLPRDLDAPYRLYCEVLGRKRDFTTDNLKIMLARVPTVFEDSFAPFGRNDLHLATALSRYSVGLFYKDVLFADSAARGKFVRTIRQQAHVPLERRQALIDYALQNSARFQELAKAMLRRALEGDAITFPHELCLHLVVVSRDDKMLLVKRSQHVAHGPGKWALSVEEQMKPEDISAAPNMYEYGERTIFEELNLASRQEVRRYCDLGKNVRVLSVFVEQPRLNLSFCAIAFLDVDAREVDASIQGKPGPSQQEFRTTYWIPATAPGLAKWLVAWPGRYPPLWTSVYRAAMAYFNLFGRD